MPETVASEKNASLIRCPSCGAEHDASAAKCPFCGHINEGADEQVFFRDLNDSRQAVQQMVDLPEETATREVRHAGRLIVLALVAFAAIAALFLILFRLTDRSGSHRDTEADYRWAQENLPEYQAAYEAGMSSGDFSALLDLYEAGRKDNAPTWLFERDQFMTALYTLDNMDNQLSQADEWKESGGTRYLNHMKLLFYDEMELALIPDNDLYTEEEKAVLIPLSAPYVKDLKTRFSLTEEEFASFRSAFQKKNYLSYTECESFVSDRLK
ncbi:MAG: zinc ribbon domain-containing protein [Lachnospiraceae bacterium]|nr:zinc ribbon domain-containing protein [Lachnospiraceae bacterium]